MAFVWGVLQEIDQTMFGISLDVTFPLTFGGPNQATTFFACLLHACVGQQCDPKNGARKSSSCCSVATHTEVHSHSKTSQRIGANPINHQHSTDSESSAGTPNRSSESSFRTVLSCELSRAHDQWWHPMAAQISTHLINKKLWAHLH